MTVNAGLSLIKSLKQRHAELTTLRGQNLNRTRYRQVGVADEVEEPTYDVKIIDAKIVALAKEIRLLDAAIKESNAKTEIAGFQHDESVLSAIQ